MKLIEAIGAGLRRLPGYGPSGGPLPLFGVLLCCVLAATPALAQGRPIKATLVQNLDFGIVGATDVIGTVTVTSAGSKTVSAGILDLGGVAVAATFDIQGERNTVFTITLPASATITVGGSTAQLTQFESTPSLTGTLNAKGQATVTVGATLNLTPSLAEGAYTGVFDIIVSY